MKSLMMMRTRGLSGPAYAKHANLNRLSKSTGNSQGGLRMLRGWGGPANCETQDLTLITIQFSDDISYTTVGQGITFAHSDGGIFTIASATGAGTPLIQYTGSWDIAPDAGARLAWDYDGTGDYVDGDGESLSEGSGTLINCAAAGTWLDENSDIWVNELDEEWTTT